MARSWVVPAVAALLCVHACGVAARHRSRRAVDAIVPAGLGEVKRLRVVDSSGARTHLDLSDPALGVDYRA